MLFFVTATNRKGSIVASMRPRARLILTRWRKMTNKLSNQKKKYEFLTRSEAPHLFANLVLQIWRLHFWFRNFSNWSENTFVISAWFCASGKAAISSLAAASSHEVVAESSWNVAGGRRPRHLSSDTEACGQFVLFSRIEQITHFCNRYYHSVWMLLGFFSQPGGTCFWSTWLERHFL